MRESENRQAGELTEIDQIIMAEWRASGWRLPSAEERLERLDDSVRKIGHAMKRLDNLFAS